jgi:hypothetical protein
MQEFIRRANITEFRRLLAKTIDPDQRRILKRLLAEEQAKALPPKEGRDDD